MRILGLDPGFDEQQFADASEDDLLESYQTQVNDSYARKGGHIAELLLPVIKQVYEKEGHKYKRIAINYTDGRSKQLPISADLKDAVDSDGRSIMRDIEKAITLALIDENWKEHLRSMDELKESVQSASFEQKDPLVIYKMEAYNLFEELIYKVNHDVCSYLMNGMIMVGSPDQVREAKEQKSDLNKAQTSREAGMSRSEMAMREAAQRAGQQQRQKVETVRRDQPKVGRNEACPCGSGKKYKHCHGKK